MHRADAKNSSFPRKSDTYLWKFWNGSRKIWFFLYPPDPRIHVYFRKSLDTFGLTDFLQLCANACISYRIAQSDRKYKRLRKVAGNQSTRKCQEISENTHGSWDQGGIEKTRFSYYRSKTFTGMCHFSSENCCFWRLRGAYFFFNLHCLATRGQLVGIAKRC